MDGYGRVLLKLSGEAMGAKEEIFDFEKLNDIARMIAKLWHTGVEVALVIGGGNIWRGRRGPSAQMNAVAADHMGMLATVINALAMQDALERVDKDIQARVMTATNLTGCAEPYNWRQAMHHLQRGRIVLFAYGTGEPLHSTDTAAAQRAIEIQASAMLFAKNVAGIFDKNPDTVSPGDPPARLLADLTYDDVLAMPETGGIDPGALIICKGHGAQSGLKAVRVFDLNDPQNIMRVAKGEGVGTTIHS